MDDNEVGMTDFTGLNLMSFDIFPHYDRKFEDIIVRYEKGAGQEVKRLTDDDYLVISVEE